MRYIGIDPGISGAIAFLEDGCEPYVCKAPVAKTGAKGRNEPDCYGMVDELMTVRGELSTSNLGFAVIEHVNPQKKFSTGNFIFGGSFWAWRMLLSAKQVPFELVRPKTWQKEFGIGGKDCDTKAQAVAACVQLFPTVDVTKQTADALLIAEFARRKHTGGTK